MDSLQLSRLTASYELQLSTHRQEISSLTLQCSELNKKFSDQLAQEHAGMANDLA